MGKPTIYVDMDGVLADFDGKIRSLTNVKSDPNEVLGSTKVQDLARETPNFFGSLKVLPHSLELLRFVNSIAGGYSILSSCLKTDPETSERGKTKWIATHLQSVPAQQIIFEREKYKYAVQEDGTPNILVDDWDHNINLWNAHGGIGILYHPDKFEVAKEEIKRAYEEASSTISHPVDTSESIINSIVESKEKIHPKPLTSEQVISYAQSIHHNYKLVRPIKKYDTWVLTEMKLCELSTVEYGRYDDPYGRRIRLNFEHINSIDPNFIRPIIVDDKGFILDGNHRATKARMEGRKTIMTIKPVIKEGKFDNLRADPNFALACKRLAPVLQMKMLVYWPDENSSDENYKVKCVYCVNPKTGIVYWSNGTHDNEDSFLHQFPKGSAVSIGLSDLQDEIRDKKIAPFNKAKAEPLEKYAKEMLMSSIKKPVKESKLMEGGNVFKNEEGPLTQRINREDIKPTLVFLEKLTGLPLMNNTLGSVGKKASSGDIDVGVDERLITKEELVKKLAVWVEKVHSGDKPRLWIAKSGDSVHFRTPIAGKESNGYVQTDFMFGSDPEFQKFSMMSIGDQSNYSGEDRNILLASLAKARGAKWSYKAGLVNRETGEVLSKDPKKIAQFLLNNKSASAEQLHSVESIISAIKNDPNFDNLIADARETFAKKGKQL
jgi:5'-nucleotidase